MTLQDQWPWRHFRSTRLQHDAQAVASFAGWILAFQSPQISLAMPGSAAVCSVLHFLCQPKCKIAGRCWQMFLKPLDQEALARLQTAAKHGPPKLRRKSLRHVGSCIHVHSDVSATVPCAGRGRQVIATARSADMCFGRLSCFRPFSWGMITLSGNGAS